MPTIQQVAAKLTREVADTLVRNIRAMPADKVVWQPMEKGRTALSQLQECATICGLSIYTLTNFALAPDFREAFDRERAEIDTAEKAIARLEESSAKLAEIIAAYPDGDLDRTVQMPWLPHPSSMADLMFMNYWNAAYHVGQISYIQTLYGDNESH